MDTFRILTDEDQEPIRIDRFLSDTIPDMSRSFLQKLLKEDLVLVNQKPVKANYKVGPMEEVLVSAPDQKEPDILPEDILLISFTKIWI